MSLHAFLDLLIALDASGSVWAYVAHALINPFTLLCAALLITGAVLYLPITYAYKCLDRLLDKVFGPY